jgi:hypothetical protein
MTFETLTKKKKFYNVNKISIVLGYVPEISFPSSKMLSVLNQKEKLFFSVPHLALCQSHPRLGQMDAGLDIIK